MVGQPTLRLRARRDGTWNLQGLIADPWPGPRIETPPITIRKLGTLELFPCDEPASNADRPQAEACRSSAPAVAAGITSGAASLALTAAGFLSRLSAASPGGHVTVDQSPAVLRDVSLKIKAASSGASELEFEGTARGDSFERMTLSGSINLQTGILDLRGELSGLVLSESLRRKLPPDARPAEKALSLNGGVIDLDVHRFRYDPAAAPEHRKRYSMTARIREGVWDCPNLPFPINDLAALVSIEDRVLTIKRAHGTNGMTTLDAEGVMTLDGIERTSMNLHVNLDDLELDDRLRNRTPDEYKELWELFKPRGRINIELNLARKSATAPLDWSASVRCRDVAAVYRHFPYPLDHLTGVLKFDKDILTVDLKSLSGRPSKIAGKIFHPGPDAVVELDVIATALPIDDALKKAMPRDVRKVVDQFNPSGLVNARAGVSRKPMHGPGARPEGLVEIDAVVDLTEQL